MNRFVRVPMIALLVASSLVAGSAFADAPAAQHEKTHAHAGKGPIERALSQVQLRQDQRAAADAILLQTKPSHAAVKASRKALRSALATQVEIGRVDRKALRAFVDAVAIASQDERRAERTAFEKLHALMDAKQRAAFADAMTAAMADHPHRDRLESLERYLKLSPDQKKELEKAIDAEKAKHPDKRGAKSFEGFKQDKLAIDSVLPSEARAQMFARIERELRIAEKIAPLLTPEQRARAATKLRGM